MGQNNLRHSVKTMCDSTPAKPLLFFAFRIYGRRVEEQKMDFQLQKIWRGKEDFLLDRLFMLQDKIHDPVKMVKRDRLRVAQGHILAHPFLHPPPLGVRSQCQVADNGENRPLSGKNNPAPRKSLGQYRIQSQTLPDLTRKISASQGHA